MPSPTSKPVIELEHRLAVPTAYAASWLTDFRPDDGPRWFGFDSPSEVTVTTDGVHIESPLSFGRNVNDVHLESAGHWITNGEARDRKGRVVHALYIDETVGDDGDGCLHRVRIWLTSPGISAKVTLALGRLPMRRALVRGLARMKVAMEQDHAAGRPARD